MDKIILGEERVYLVCRSQFMTERSQGRDKSKGHGRMWATALFHVAVSTLCFNTVLVHLPRDGTTYSRLLYQLVIKQMPYTYAWQEQFLNWHALLPDVSSEWSWLDPLLEFTYGSQTLNALAADDFKCQDKPGIWTVYSWVQPTCEFRLPQTFLCGSSLIHKLVLVMCTPGKNVKKAKNHRKYQEN